MFTPLEIAYFTLQRNKYHRVKNIRKKGVLYDTYIVFLDNDLYYYLLIDSNNDKVFVTDIYDYSEDINESSIYYDFDLLVNEVR